MGTARRTSVWARRRGSGLTAVVAAGVFVAAALSVTAAAPAGSSPLAAERTVHLAGDGPPAAALRGGPGQPATAAEDRAPVTVTLTLRRTDEAGFQRFASAVLDPHSPDYHHFAGQQVLADRFGPSLEGYGQVRSWLRGRGLHVVQQSVNRLTISARGTRRQVGQAFGVHLLDHRMGRRDVYANDDAPALPAGIASLVTDVSGLSDAVEPSAPAYGSTPDDDIYCADALTQYLPTIPTLEDLIVDLLIELFPPLAFLDKAEELGKAIKLAYCAGMAVGSAIHQLHHGAAASSPGTTRTVGPANPQKVGLLEFDSFHVSDVADWLHVLGVDAAGLTSRLSSVAVNGGVSAPGPGESEVLLDVDSVMGLAPSADTSYVVYDAPASTSFEQMFNAMIDDGDTVISNSWSQCEDDTSQAEADAIDSVLAQAEASGISVFNGSGDHGSTCLDGAADTIGVPADSPHATAVGGTTTHLGPQGTYQGETWWGSGASDTGEGGFGVSHYFSRPSYQDGHTSSTMRSVPDVAENADPRDGVAICQADAGSCPGGQVYGGTSMAAPEMAGLTADLNEELGTDIGGANAVFYGHSTAFHGPSALGSDFAHVGLGSVDFPTLTRTLLGEPLGPPSASTSDAAGDPEVPADGASTSTIRVDLLDSNGFPVPGRTVTLTRNSGSHASVSAASGKSSAQGSVTFTVKDATVENVTLTAVDTTDGITITQKPVVHFVAPAATAGGVAATPGIVVNDGVAAATVTVTLHDASGHGAAGKQVTVSGGTSSAVVLASSAASSVTNASGVASFTVTDEVPEAATFTATDVTDGDLPVPGSATVTFNGQGEPPCPPNSGTGLQGTVVTAAVTGIPQAGAPGCNGVFGIAFDASGHLYVADQPTADIYKFPSPGGVASPSTRLSTALEDSHDLTDLAIGKDGSVYVLNPGDDNGGLDRIDPTTGALESVVTTGVGPDPAWLAVDPLTGDLFVTAFQSGELWRVHDPASNAPTVTSYVDDPAGFYQDAFAPNGTLYAATRDGRLVRIGGTNTDQPASETTVTNLPASSGDLALGPVDSNGVPTAVFAAGTPVSGGIGVFEIDLPSGTTTQIATATAAGAGLQVGPDGCVYSTNKEKVVRISTGDGSCGLTAPQVTLSGPDVPTPAAGSAVTFSARLQGVASPAGTPILFSVAGANPQVRLVGADSGGSASFTYRAAHPGDDVVTAVAESVTGTPRSAPIRFTWAAGKDTSAVTLDGSQEAGSVGQPATFAVHLTDRSTPTASPVSGASVAVGLGAQSCIVTTDSAGGGTCTISPTDAGLQAVTATYAGSGSETASSASAPFVAGPRDPAPPTVSISPAAVVRPASGTTPLVFTVSLDHTAASDTSVRFHTVDGTAVALLDYTPASGDAVVPAGQTSTTVTVPVLGNQTDEPDKAFTVVLSSPTNAVVGTGTASGTIQANHLLEGCPASPTATQRYVCHLYVDALGRAAEPSGLAYWVHLLSTGTTRLKMATSYLGTPEARDVLVDRLYVLFLHRHGDAGGVAYWAGKLKAGAKPDDIRAFLTTSSEFYADGGGTHAGFVQELFQDLDRRSADLSGLLYWRTKLDAGASRPSVVSAFLQATESHTHVIDDVYLRFLRRTPTSAELTSLLETLSSQGEIAIYDSTAASTEYFNRP